MSLQVSNLTKIYGQQKAVNNISFEVQPGEIVGFLGPNGAGKSTTMKISTGYMPPTSGRVLVNGLDVTTQSLQVRKIMGYLPEHNPLYLDMYVHEYLHFVGKVFDLTNHYLKSRIAEIVSLCGLDREQNKKIEQLSKGFRQRVGLAQALIHNPQVLVLDEPTTGLDPNQILEIRKLIKEISASKTVLFSTHIMQEVQAICNRVIVINQGELVADAPVADLLKSQAQVQIIVEFDAPVDEQKLATLPGVQHLVMVTPNVYKLTTVQGADLRPEVFRFATEQNLSLVGLRQEQLSLEEIFRSLTAQTPAE
ncbi:MAG TPA: gliding motility-associated ABC transporter ATP-binding subunit GldA [Cyclobacteriaceae bacterium]|jgi:ABC-2 type transport system ATP-binding protein|nr:gliding motility-associated ABC transporter ATP-binding subunit GldA [Cytophagales bacterium]HRE66303.1 gliding motility-associated ABC transporter ATP-binding subunit GldA [Cyclobacteriaceae bacterium]HRF32875.1 gliding motility-associated ABC transporter ATP-binding subunit GldA [Cyclobacteriaceae bacterium]